MTCSREHRQAGFSLVELMIALVISLLLLAGILQILLGNRESFDKQKTLASMQENARLVSFVIENVVAHAGYRVNLSAPDTFIFPPYSQDSAHGLPIQAGAVVASNDGGQNGNDAVRIRFQASGGVHDCQSNDVGGAGNKDPNGDMALYVNADDNLECAVYSNGDAGQAQPLVSNVDRFKVTYGLDTDGDDSVDTYVKELTAADATQIRSLHIQLLLRTDDPVLPHGFDRTYTFADGTDKTIPAKDRRARQLVDQTVALRNLLP